MLKRYAALAVATCCAAVPSMAAADEAAVTETISVAGDQFVCEDATYTIVSGEVHFTLHEGESASGNQNFTITISARSVEAVSSATGETVRIVGAFWAGFTANAKTGGFQATTTDHFQIFLRITLPLSKPALATLAVLSFLTNWNEFIWPIFVIFRLRLPPLGSGPCSRKRLSALSRTR